MHWYRYNYIEHGQSQLPDLKQNKKAVFILKSENVRKNIYSITYGAVIAAIYAALTVVLAPISYGNWQFRISEALTILPVFSPASVAGLTVGCIVSNGVGFSVGANIAGPWDILFGSLATLLAAVSTRMLRNIKFFGIPFLALLPPVVFNALIVGGEISVAYSLPYWVVALEVGFGQLVVCYALGIPLYFAYKNASSKIPQLTD